MSEVISFTMQVLIGLVVSLIIFGAERIWKIYITDRRIIAILNKLKVIFLHIIISCLVWHYGKNYTIIKPLDIFDITIDLRIFFIIFLNVMIWITRLKYSQINGEKYISGRDESELQIYRLKLDSKRRKLKLSWETFGRGIELLTEKICDASGIEPDVVFGINEAGIIIASYISFYLHRIPLGNIKTAGTDKSGKRIYLQFDCPKSVPNPKCILVVDSELKRGTTSKEIISRLKDLYKENLDNQIRIIYAVLVGVAKDSNINSVYDFGWEMNPHTETEYKPDFLSFFINKPGFEPPGKIR
ncbi:hypothetical protein JXJ21_13425 [candidate division KSB1 bacterium]|nr:hypothetical protein [candidate division KSB1 bacterium]